jgi:MFS transporter, SP family, sugar:H+ symporter
MLIAAAAFAISSVLSGLAFAVWDLILWRFIAGIGIGIASVIAPAYIAEIAPASLRGRLGSLQQLAIVTGIFISLLVDYIFATAAGGSTEVIWGLPAWRWMFLAMGVPAIVYGVLSLTIPESPRYLIANLRIPEARKVLTTMLGTAGTEVRIQRIQSSLQSDHKPSFRDLRAPKGGLLPIVWIGIMLSVFQQFVGINVIFYYSNVLWEAVGFSEADSFKITVITAIVNIVTTLIAIASIDRFGRKPLLIIGSIGMTITLGIMAFVFGIARTTTDANGAVTPVLEGWQGPAALIAANVYVIAFGMSWGPVVWVLLGESFPNKIRAAALSVAAMAQWVANWLITVSFPKMKDISLAFSYGFYAACALLSLFFVLKWVRETKGKELEDMDEMIAAPH